MISQHSKQALKNPWVLGLIACFTVFVLVNVLFIYTAFDQAPTLVTTDHYQQDERYQQKIQHEQGLEWTGVLLSPAEIRLNQSQDYQVIFQDKQGQPVQLDNVVLSAYRPADTNADFELTMTRQSTGIYQAQLHFSLPGEWDILVQAVRGEKQFSLTRRLTVSP